MDYKSFKDEFFGYLNKNDKKCLKFIEKNGKFIESCFGNRNSEILNEFANEIGNFILQNKGDFKLIEKVLKSKYFEQVYYVFKNTKVLVNACKDGKVEAANWLLTMDINPYIQDKMGRSALMYAVQNKNLQKVVEQYGTNYRCVMLEDSVGNTALYYAIENVQAIDNLREVDVNHVNHNHETAPMYFCKKKIAYAIKPLVKRKGLDINIPDKEGKTLPMVLIENFNINELDSLRQNKHDFNYINEKGESVISILIREMYRKKNPQELYSKYAKIIICLLKAEVDFNTVVDEDGNTAIMAILIAHDYETFNFICRNGKNLNFQKKNKYGENATSLFLKLDFPSSIVNPMVYQHSFDYKYRDEKNNNTSLILTLINKPHLLIDALLYHNCSINYFNSHKETALIIAVIMNNYNAVEVLLRRGADVNQQDEKGNTALHYAVQMRNVAMVYDMMNNFPNPLIKNNEKISAIELAEKIGDQKILDALHNRLPEDKYSKEKSAAKKAQVIRLPQFEEYLYMNTSSFYSGVIDEDRIKQIKSEYKLYTDTVNNNMRHVNFGPFADDLMFFLAGNRYNMFYL